MSTERFMSYFCSIPLGLILLVVFMFWFTDLLKKLFSRKFWNMVRARLGRGRAISELAARLKIDEAYLRAIEPQYTEKHIPKRSGGTRVLHVPSPDLKSVQRRILRL